MIIRSQIYDAFMLRARIRASVYDKRPPKPRRRVIYRLDPYSRKVTA